MRKHLKVIGKNVDGLWVVWLENSPQTKFAGHSKEDAVKELMSHYGAHLVNAGGTVKGNVDDVAAEFTLQHVARRNIPVPSVN